MAPVYNSKARGALVVIVATAVLAIGCASTPTQQSVGEYASNTVLEGRVKSSLLADPETSGLAIKVESFKNAVQLSGFVESEQEKQRAGEVVSNTTGVDQVFNDLIVRSEVRPAQPKQQQPQTP